MILCEDKQVVLRDVESASESDQMQDQTIVQGVGSVVEIIGDETDTPNAFEEALIGGKKSLVDEYLA